MYLGEAHIQTVYEWRASKKESEQIFFTSEKINIQIPLRNAQHVCVMIE